MVINVIKLLPTGPLLDGRKIAAFYAELRHLLLTNRGGKELRFYSYAITLRGWDRIRKSIKRWRNNLRGRQVRIYCGLDHHLTEPKALLAIMEDGIPLFLVPPSGVTFHPKLVVIDSAETLDVLVGSNNLTDEGLNKNREFAAFISITKTNSGFNSINQRILDQWGKAVHEVTKRATKSDVLDYTEEYRAAQQLPRNKTPIGKRRLKRMQQYPGANVGMANSAILEVMPKETGTLGSQIQIPMELAKGFFGLPHGDSVRVRMVNKESREKRVLTMTDYPNVTTRLSIHELQPSDRPCLLKIRRIGSRFEFSIVRQNDSPHDYSRLLSLCFNQTTRRSRRWGVFIENDI